MPAALPSATPWKPSSWQAVQAAIAAVTRLGGRVLADNCSPRDLDFTLPAEQRKFFERAPKKMAPARSAGCGLRARIGLPYINPNGGESMISVCAVDDAVELWPRVARELR